jgi:hypothetical protein
MLKSSKTVMNCPDHVTRFKRWYVRPYNRLKKIKNGDGQFVALSIGLFLCERYYRTKTKTQNDPHAPSNRAFMKEAASDLKVDQELFNKFWLIYRHGMQHQGMPKKVKEKKNGMEIWNRWLVDPYIGGPFFERPTSYIDSQGQVIICLNIWKFTDLMIKKFLDNPAMIADAFTHALAEIYSDSRKKLLPKP